MKLWLGVGSIILIGILSGQGFADQGPEVVNVDQKISIRADNVTLWNLLRLWDQATGMHSRVPPELANRTLSVRFTALGVNDALRKIFDGQPFGYMLTENQLLVEARSPSESTAEPEPLPPPADNAIAEVNTEPALPEIMRLRPAPPPPTYIPTPFGPIVNPTGADRPFIQLPPVPMAPSPPFFRPEYLTLPPSGAPNGPVQNSLFGPLPLYTDSNWPSFYPRP
jgi:hypothetical protein